MRVCGQSVLFAAASEWDSTQLVQTLSRLSINSTNH